MYNFIKTIAEGRTPKELKQISLPYARDGLGRSLSKASIDYHFGQLYKGYVDRFNAGEGDPDFNEAGAYLHSIYYSQFMPPKGNNKPVGKILEFIEKHHKSYDKFQESFEKTAMKIQGSGWVYLAKNGDIKTIANHAIRDDIIILVDWWEHAWALDYRADKQKYLSNQWKIMDWSVINNRIFDFKL
jgi:Fe-Mn family superoxide dismutase